MTHWLRVHFRAWIFRRALRVTRNQIVLVLLLCAFDALTPQIARALTDAEVKQALVDFTSDKFNVREAASAKLSTALRKNELTSEQLGLLRVAADSKDLEVRSRAQQVITDFERSVPAVRDIVEATRVQGGFFQNGQANYGIDSVFANTDTAKKPFTDIFKLYEAARNSFLGGATNDVEAKYKAFRDRVAGLSDDELKALGIDKDVQEEILERIDDAIKKIPEAIKTIGQGTNNAPPPARDMVAVPAAGGVVDLGLTFRFSIIGSIVPGSVDFFLPDDSDALFSPSPRFRFAGVIFDLLESTDLDLTGSTVSIGLEFGPGLLSGNPIDPTRPVCLARLANGRTDLLSCTDDPTVFILNGLYPPESKASGALQLGEFALVQPVPEVGSLALVLFGAAMLGAAGSLGTRGGRAKRGIVAKGIGLTEETTEQFPS